LVCLFVDWFFNIYIFSFLAFLKLFSTTLLLTCFCCC
jgi:hypothetical protein